MRTLDRLARRAARSRVLSTLTHPYTPGRLLELVDPLWSDRDLAEVTAVRHETDDVVTLVLRPAAGWPGHRAGQHTVLRVEVAGVTHARAFTLASSAHEHDRVELTMKAHADGVVVPWLQQHAAPGLVVGLDHPSGDVHLPEARPDDLLLVGAGSGTTPPLSVLRTLRDEGHTGRVTFVHLARTRADALFVDELRGAEAALPGCDVHVLLTREDGHPGRGARLDAELLDRLHPTWRDALAVVCGPADMLEAAEALWDAQADRDRLLVERFRPAPLVLGEPGGGTITFTRSGVAVDDDGRTLLEQAEAAGLSPESGCRMGICHSCDVRKTAGPTRDVRDGRVHAGPTPGEGNTTDKVQVCVSVACGDVAVDL